MKYPSLTIATCSVLFLLTFFVEKSSSMDFLSAREKQRLDERKSQQALMLQEERQRSRSDETSGDISNTPSRGVLAPVVHNSRNERGAKTDGVSLRQHPSLFPASGVEENKMSGLALDSDSSDRATVENDDLSACDNFEGGVKIVQKKESATFRNNKQRVFREEAYKALQRMEKMKMQAASVFIEIGQMTEIDDQENEYSKGLILVQRQIGFLKSLLARVEQEKSGDQTNSFDSVLEKIKESEFMVNEYLNNIQKNAMQLHQIGQELVTQNLMEGCTIVTKELGTQYAKK